ncbi:delta 9-fatty acid desaturase [Exidia glandulosa HHB12029]|uniref:Acyl-CoA desaturase n=1 Tax=Exidia glandulosa HHB12029 TaxID=1314781 RepID=A0A165BRE2_EXIGL|nr:delta 9-fatty acid desaturase [Exidia glandulosa HHB12029]
MAALHVRTDAAVTKARPNDEPVALTPPMTPPTLDAALPPVTTSAQPIPENYVEHILKTTKALPPITLSTLYREINWLSLGILTVSPALAIYGLRTTHLSRQTTIWSIVYYFITGLGITAGYHRLWSHRCYNASKPLEWFLALAGAGAVQGSIRWWSRGHRAHHRYTDTELDPYSAHKGLLWSHIGWLVLLPRRKPGVADVSDLSRNPIVMWQNRNYRSLFLLMGFIFPTLVAGLGWGDWWGGFFFAGAARLCFVHHSTFCINSLAHWIGETPFDDKHTPRDHFLTALVTIGEGYHNFHHEFPSDYRNAIKWFQYDPTKWFIKACQLVGLASQLKKFPDNEIKKGQLTMELKKMREIQDKIVWPSSSNDLPVVSWESFQEQARHRPLIVVAGFIHDVSSFVDEHPGGRHLLSKNFGKDATVPFFGGVYDHSNAAHNLLAMMRVGVLRGGLEIESEKAIPPSQRLKVVRAEEMFMTPESSGVDEPDA